MGRLQPILAKIGEVKFRRRLVKQHQGLGICYPTHTTPLENLKLLRQRAENSFKIFKNLQNQNILLSPFLELGGEKCERAAVLTTKMGGQGAVVDLSAESLESAANFCPKIGLKNLPLRICADAYHLPFANNSFAFVFTFQTLHHFPDPAPITTEIYRVLSPGGYFYFDEEPIKQKVNISLWRRDYHLRWWEKILKMFLILPFISTIGKSEVSEGVLEETFDLSAWERALNQFYQANAVLAPYPLGPKTKLEKGKKGWLKPKLSTGLLINLTGGGIKALCFKKGNLKLFKKNISNLLACPNCQGKLKKLSFLLTCPKCQEKYPIKNGILYLLTKDLREKLYP